MQLVPVHQSLDVRLGDEAAAMAIDLVEYCLQRGHLGHSGLNLDAERLDLHFHVYASTKDAPEQVFGLQGHFVGLLSLLDIVPVANVDR